MEETLARATKNDRERAGLTDQSERLAANEPFPRPEQAAIARDGDTEYLLNGLIAECHYMMRELALPTAAETKDSETRQQYISCAMNLALTGAKLGKSVAEVRSAGMTRELRQRHIIEHLERAAPPPAAADS
ncbi:MAG TPA: hypothetical protein VHE09_00435 [Rhizomicrobium sp.]|nr:hypothetical protein [Rhizomicrobium sp.]